MSPATSHPPPATQEIGPQPGPQTRFLASEADIAIYGGAAGAGKTYALLLEAVTWIDVPHYGATVFRRTFPRITAKGGLWDESKNLYSQFGGTPRENDLLWRFPGGATVKFAHLQRSNTVKDWHGSQIPLIIFDELTEFEEEQFWYLLSRNRSTCGVRPYIRATCNPDADSWVAKLLEWWIDQETGYPIPERSGVLRYFVRLDDELHWGDSQQEMIERFGERGKSITFIAGSLADNKVLEEKDPDYRRNLEALPLVERERLLGGNWKIRPAAGLLFPRDRWQYCDEAPEGLRLVRYWDKAITPGGKGARTAGVLMGAGDDRWYLCDGLAGRWGEAEREQTIRDTADQDAGLYGHVAVWMEEEPGSSGKVDARATIRKLAGHDAHAQRVTGSKVSRWRPLAAQQQAGNVVIVRGSWDYVEFVRELDRLSGDTKQDEKLLKDYADAASGAFNVLSGRSTATWDRPLLGGTTEEEAAAVEYERQNPDKVREFQERWQPSWKGLAGGR